ncbi:MAG: hypothetical protein EON61_13955 [Alphaproteobacteria bacterium]|nr:MAG: hypothetical protein EON61_13955 [Alphaproteobacteria bacterium]
MKNPARFIVAPVLAFGLSACGPDKPVVEAPAVTAPMAEQPASYAATPAPGEELPPSQTTAGPIPLEFRHVWAIDAKDCTADPSLRRIAIAPGAIKFYEGRSEVTSVDAPHVGAAVLRVTHAAEGQTASETHTLALDETKTTLTYKRGDNPPLTYKRCD